MKLIITVSLSLSCVLGKGIGRISYDPILSYVETSFPPDLSSGGLLIETTLIVITELL